MKTRKLFQLMAAIMLACVLIVVYSCEKDPEPDPDPTVAELVSGSLNKLTTETTVSSDTESNPGFVTISFSSSGEAKIDLLYKDNSKSDTTLATAAVDKIEVPITGGPVLLTEELGTPKYNAVKDASSGKIITSGEFVFTNNISVAFKATCDSIVQTIGKISVGYKSSELAIEHVNVTEIFIGDEIFNEKNCEKYEIILNFKVTHTLSGKVEKFSYTFFGYKEKAIVPKPDITGVAEKTRDIVYDSDGTGSGNYTVTRSFSDETSSDTTFAAPLTISAPRTIDGGKIDWTGSLEFGTGSVAEKSDLVARPSVVGPHVTTIVYDWPQTVSFANSFSFEFSSVYTGLSYKQDEKSCILTTDKPAFVIESVTLGTETEVSDKLETLVTFKISEVYGAAKISYTYTKTFVKEKDTPTPVTITGVAQKLRNSVNYGNDGTGSGNYTVTRSFSDETSSDTTFAAALTISAPRNINGGEMELSNLTFGSGSVAQKGSPAGRTPVVGTNVTTTVYDWPQTASFENGFSFDFTSVYTGLSYKQSDKTCALTTDKPTFTVKSITPGTETEVGDKLKTPVVFVIAENYGAKEILYTYTKTFAKDKPAPKIATDFTATLLSKTATNANFSFYVTYSDGTDATIPAKVNYLADWRYLGNIQRVNRENLTFSAPEVVENTSPTPAISQNGGFTVNKYEKTIELIYDKGLSSQFDHSYSTDKIVISYKIDDVEKQVASFEYTIGHSHSTNGSTTTETENGTNYNVTEVSFYHTTAFAGVTGPQSLVRSNIWVSTGEILTSVSELSHNLVYSSETNEVTGNYTVRRLMGSTPKDTSFVVKYNTITLYTGGVTNDVLLADHNFGTPVITTDLPLIDLNVESPKSDHVTISYWKKPVKFAFQNGYETTFEVEFSKLTYKQGDKSCALTTDVPEVQFVKLETLGNADRDGKKITYYDLYVDIKIGDRIINMALTFRTYVPLE